MQRFMTEMNDRGEEMELINRKWRIKEGRQIALWRSMSWCQQLEKLWILLGSLKLIVR